MNGMLFGEIVLAVSARTGIPAEEIMAHGKGRAGRGRAPISMARAAVCATARLVAHASYPRIASMIGYLDHTSVIASVRRADFWAERNQDYAALLAAVRADYLACASKRQPA